VDLTIRPVQEADWRKLRRLRLAMLSDEPKAYLETYDAAAKLGRDDWRARARRSAAPGGVGLVAETRNGRWVGHMGGYIDAPARACLVSVYVDPAHRGSGVAAALLAAVERWALAVGADTLRLLVHADNARARRFYAREGFVETGHTEPYPLDPRELERRCSNSCDRRPTAASRPGSVTARPVPCVQECLSCRSSSDMSPRPRAAPLCGGQPKRHSCVARVSL
jgi:GNAT superfamily N-acetyltransferase